MSNTGRNANNQPLRPKLASSNTARSPLTPRLGAAARSTPTLRSEQPAVRVKQSSNETPTRDVVSNGNITPRSAARSSKIGSANNTPSHSNSTPTALSSRPTTATSGASSGRNSVVVGGGAGVTQDQARTSRANSVAIESGSSNLKAHRPLSPAASPTSTANTQNGNIDGHFFHASDASKQEAVPKRPEPKKVPSFFYADGQREDQSSPQGPAGSPPLSALSEQRSIGPWIRSERSSNPQRSSPALSPALSTVSQTQSFFGGSAARDTSQRPASPTKENIHLSYRKGASQIFGTRPLSTSRPSHHDLPFLSESPERQGSLESASNVASHHKSPSLSSIDSGNSPPSHRRSGTLSELTGAPSPLTHEVKAATVPRIVKPLGDLPSIDTSLEHPALSSPPPESNLSPTKGVSELAADARRERKVLDLEISNSSLLAINSSLEREIRRQKAELKRFRRLSRAGRFSFGPVDRTARLSEGLSAVGEEDEDREGSDFGFPLGDTDGNEDFSDDDSLASSTEPTSPSTTSRTDSDRLAKDEKRLRVDLERHKELLVQSQMMNQSIKRCMYATEDMIEEGKKALEYHVRVSDVKLGGRVLSRHDENDGMEIHDDDDHEPSNSSRLVEEDDANAVEMNGDENGPPELDFPDETPQSEDGMEEAKSIVDLWSGLGRPDHGSSEINSKIGVPTSPQPLASSPGNIRSETSLHMDGKNSVALS